MRVFSRERERGKKKHLDTRTYISHHEEQRQNDSKGANPGFLRVSTVWFASARMEEREGGGDYLQSCQQSKLD